MLPLPFRSACGIDRAETIRDLFVPSFYFGCEAEDPINAWAFDRMRNPFGARLNTLFGSDIGLIDGDDFRDFTFANAVRFFGTVNPDFLKGTVVEKAAASVPANR